MLPDFLLIGATKGGTTTLFEALAGHPEVWLHPTKELRFFTEEHNWHRGLEWYESQFEPARTSGARAVGEASNAYSRSPVYAGVSERIARVRPGMRLIYLIRDPMRRLESHYRHRLVTGIEWRDPEQAIRDDPRYLAASLYGVQVDAYLEHFPPEQLFVARSEELFAEPDSVLEPLARFLGVDPAAWPELRPENVTAERFVTPAPLRQLVRIPGAKDRVKRLGRALSASPLRHLLASAESAEFRLSDAFREDLAGQFAEDARRLAGLVAGPVRKTINREVCG